MPKDHSSFQDLERQLAKDALEKILKDLHGEIIKDIEKNKATFSKEIQKTLNAFKADLEDSISKDLDQKISAHLKNNFLDISTKVTSSFYETSSDKEFEDFFKGTEAATITNVNNEKTTQSIRGVCSLLTLKV